MLFSRKIFCLRKVFYHELASENEWCIVFHNVDWPCNIRRAATLSSQAKCRQAQQKNYVCFTRLLSAVQLASTILACFCQKIGKLMKKTELRAASLTFHHDEGTSVFICPRNNYRLPAEPSVILVTKQIWHHPSDLFLHSCGRKLTHLSIAGWGRPKLIIRLKTDSSALWGHYKFGTQRSADYCTLQITVDQRILSISFLISDPMATAAVSKLLVTDIVSHVSSVPANYIRPVSDRPNLFDVEASDSSIPLIDLRDIGGRYQSRVVEEIGQACQTDGFFQVNCLFLNIFHFMCLKLLNLN